MNEINISDPILSDPERQLGQLRFSRFIHQFLQDGVVALYHSLTHEVVFLEENFYRGLKEIIEKDGKEQKKTAMESAIEHLLQDKFLVFSNYDENTDIQKIRKCFLSKPAFRILYLLLTDICNLRCRYCFIERPMEATHQFSLMTKSIAVKGLALFASLLAQNPKNRRFFSPPSIIFYGGEPLLNQATFFSSIDEISRMKKEEKLPRDISVILITNATVLSDEIVEVVKRNNVSVSVSLDGPQDIHDSNRVFLDKKGSFQSVMENIRRLEREGVDLSISCTINAHNLDCLEGVFEWIINNIKLKGLGFNLLLDLPGTIQATEDYVRMATDKMIKCYEIARSRGIYEDRMMRKINAFTKKRLHLTDCGGCGNQIVITPNGAIGPCQAYLGNERFFPGHVDNLQFNPFSDSVFLEWSSRSPFNIPECRSCKAIGLCGGGCVYNAYLKSGSIWGIDSNFCLHSKKILEWLIWDLLKKTKERR